MHMRCRCEEGRGSDLVGQPHAREGCEAARHPLAGRGACAAAVYLRYVLGTDLLGHLGDFGELDTSCAGKARWMDTQTGWAGGLKGGGAHR